MSNNLMVINPCIANPVSSHQTSLNQSSPCTALGQDRSLYCNSVHNHNIFKNAFPEASLNLNAVSKAFFYRASVNIM